MKLRGAILFALCAAALSLSGALAGCDRGERGGQTGALPDASAPDASTDASRDGSLGADGSASDASVGHDGSDATSCRDNDGDGRGAHCSAGDDCDDDDPDVWASCDQCVDRDQDGAHTGCDAYTTRVGPDCDDADVDNQRGCATCLDADGDGAYAGCDAYTTRSGPDCDDTDVDNQTACDTCDDADGDGAYAGCDAYTTRSGPDCDDADIDNQAGCATCVDTDGDGAYAGCDAYATRGGPDCDDTDIDNQAGCATCVDTDGDGAFVGCDAYTTRAGPDCDADDPDLWVSCSAGCTDADLDGYFSGCDAYNLRQGPDCDDADPALNPGAAELADDGEDNDCRDGDLVAANAQDGIFVDPANSGCVYTGEDAGSRSAPYCSLETAFMAHSSGGDFFVAQGNYELGAISLLGGGRLRLYGGYTGGGGAAAWTRSFDPTLTTLDTDGTLLTSLPVQVIHGLSIEGDVYGDLVSLQGQGQTIDVVNVRFQKGATGPLLKIGGEKARVRGCRFVGSASGIVGIDAGHTGTQGYGSLLVQESHFELTGGAVGAIGLWVRSVADALILNNTFRTHSTQNSSNLINSIYSGMTVLHNSAVITQPGGYGGHFVAAQQSPYLHVQSNAVQVLSGSLWLLMDYVNGRSAPTLQVSGNLLGPTSSVRWVRRYDGPAQTTYQTFASLPAAFVGNLEADPRFTDASAGDLMPAADSPLIDAAPDPSVTIRYFGVRRDRDGTLRPQDGDGTGGAAYDIGALEAPAL